MDLMAVNVADPAELRESAERAVVEAGQYAGATVEGLRQVRCKARIVATNAVEVLFCDAAAASIPQQNGITHDPNGYSDDEKYIVHLLERVVTVSLRTVEIVEGLAELAFRGESHA